jgi:D-3-phosphoglycerate dehydrogenase
MVKNITILIASPVSPAAIGELKNTYHVISGIGLSVADLQKELATAEVLVFRSGVSLSADVLSRAKNLRLIVRAGSGMDNIDLGYVNKNGIVFRRIPEPGARAVAELSFTMMLALARNLFRADREWRAGHWVKHDLPTYLLHRKVLGVVGAGNIGMVVGRLGAAWGMTVIGCVGEDERTPEIEAGLVAAGIRPAEFGEVVTTSDFVSIHVPLLPSTRGMFNEKVLRSMKKGSFLVNLARGGIVDERALYAILKEGGGIAGAGLDVHESEGEGKISPLASLPNVILTPHMGAQTVDSQREIGERIVQIVDDYAATKGNGQTA